MPDQNRKMSAGEHDLIGATPRRSTKQGAISRATSTSSIGSPRRKRSASAARSRRADQRHLAIRCEIAHQDAGVVARHRARRRQHADHAGLRRLGRRLDRRHRADERQVAIGGAQRRQHQGRSGVAGDHGDVGRVAVDQLAHHRPDPLHQRRLAERAIGKEGVVGGVDEVEVGRAAAIRANTVSPPRPESNTSARAVGPGRNVHGRQTTSASAPRSREAISPTESVAACAGAAASESAEEGGDRLGADQPMRLGDRDGADAARLFLDRRDDAGERALAIERRRAAGALGQRGDDGEGPLADRRGRAGARFERRLAAAAGDRLSATRSVAPLTSVGARRRRRIRRRSAPARSARRRARLGRLAVEASSAQAPPAAPSAPGPARRTAPSRAARPALCGRRGRLAGGGVGVGRAPGERPMIGARAPARRSRRARRRARSAPTRPACAPRRGSPAYRRTDRRNWPRRAPACRNRSLFHLDRRR